MVDPSLSDAFVGLQLTIALLDGRSKAKGDSALTSGQGLNKPCFSEDGAYDDAFLSFDHFAGLSPERFARI